VIAGFTELIAQPNGNFFLWSFTMILEKAGYCQGLVWASDLLSNHIDSAVIIDITRRTCRVKMKTQLSECCHLRTDAQNYTRGSIKCYIKCRRLGTCPFSCIVCDLSCSFLVQNRISSISILMLVYAEMSRAASSGIIYVCFSCCS
jgi:hypothetical protein